MGVNVSGGGMRWRRTGDEQRFRFLLVALLVTRIAELHTAIDACVTLLHRLELQLVTAQSTSEEGVKYVDYIRGISEF